MKSLYFLFTLLLINNSAKAEIPGFLQHHAKDPATASKEVPLKTGVRGRKLFSSEAIKNRSFIAAKDSLRRRVLCPGALPGQVCTDNTSFLPSEAFNEDLFLRRFLGGNFESNLLKLSDWDQGSVATVPWSGDYWPMYRGGLGARYGDPKFPQSESFKVNYAYYQKNYLKPPQNDADSLARLSPSEKYDYLLGDNDWSLTRAVWSEGKMYLDMNGKVETWFGICHGWAPAAFSIPEPIRAFEVDLKDGKGTMRVYPHDLKGMISQLWAQAHFNYNSLGGRCNDKNPKTDANGRIISSDCFDINPSSWHLALVHWVGQARQSFVLDATYDYEVWNQPISSYRLKYFNPQTQKKGGLRESIVPYAEVKKDPYKKYRSRSTEYLVGVISEVQYVVEEDANHLDSIGNPMDRLVEVTYYYDLELDKDLNIIGGEWYQLGHPDLLWKPERGAVAEVIGEDKFQPWDGLLPVPKDLFELGLRGSVQKSPLSKILDKLVEWSRASR